MNASPTRPALLFDVELWVRENLRKAPSLKAETLQAVAGFTLLWNLFEGLLCKTDANVKIFRDITKNLPSSPKLEELVDECISFYRSRYVADQKMKPIFDRLHFRPKDKKELVESVLKGKEDELGDKMLALLIIAYRIRNNLFHGLKSVDIWNDQVKNISEASRVLSIMIEAKGPYVFEQKQTT